MCINTLHKGDNDDDDDDDNNNNPVYLYDMTLQISWDNCLLFLRCCYVGEAKKAGMLTGCNT
jgi:hypothetical protein